jgi:hypothetical protein
MNSTFRRLIIYGDTLVLAGMRANLETNPDLEVLVFDRPLGDPAKALRSFCPATVIFDLKAIPPDFPPAFLQQSDLVLIGLNPETHQALVWSGQQFSALSMQELIELIQKGGQGDLRSK